MSKLAHSNDATMEQIEREWRERDGDEEPIAIAAHFPMLMPVRWTHYGRWDDDAMHVRNQLGQVIYSVPGAPAPRTLPQPRIKEAWEK